MSEYFPVDLKINSKDYHCIWFTNGKDGLITELGKIKSFPNIKNLYDYAEANNIQFNDEETEVCFDTAIKWLKNKKTIDCKYFIDYWNMVGDIANSLNLRFYGNKRTKYMDVISQRLKEMKNYIFLNGQRKILGYLQR